MYKLFIAAQLWFGYHPVVTGPGIPPGTRIVEIRGDMITLDTAISYCVDSDWLVSAAKTEGNSITCIRSR